MITDIRLQHFRAYEDASFELDPGVNIIVGPNASGKTNLLEAVLVLCLGVSYRARDMELIGFDASWARLDAHTPAGLRVVKIVRKEPDTAVKTFEIDEQKLTRLHQARTLPVVLFEPNHLLLLSGAPDLRRNLLDDLIEQTLPGFGATRRHYRRVLTQRNTLLKRQPPNLSEQLFVWNVRLSELGGQIVRQRLALIASFNAEVTELYSSLAGYANTIELTYDSRFNPENYESELLRKLESSLEHDVQRGFTAYGPHRDDLGVYINGRRSQETASRGETRTLVLTIKILELRLLERVRSQKPLLLLDDVFSELDGKRRQALTQYVRKYQTFITTTDADVVMQHFTGSSNVIPISRRLPVDEH